MTTLSRSKFYRSICDKININNWAVFSLISRLGVGDDDFACLYFKRWIYQKIIENLLFNAENVEWYEACQKDPELNVFPLFLS